MPIQYGAPSIIDNASFDRGRNDRHRPTGPKSIHPSNRVLRGCDVGRRRRLGTLAGRGLAVHQTRQPGCIGPGRHGTSQGGWCLARVFAMPKWRKGPTRHLHQLRRRSETGAVGQCRFVFAGCVDFGRREHLEDAGRQDHRQSALPRVCFRGLERLLRRQGHGDVDREYRRARQEVLHPALPEAGRTFHEYPDQLPWSCS